MIGRQEIEKLGSIFLVLFSENNQGKSLPPPPPPPVLGGNRVLQSSFPRNQSLSDKAIKNFYVFKYITVSGQHFVGDNVYCYIVP